MEGARRGIGNASPKSHYRALDTLAGAGLTKLGFDDNRCHRQSSPPQPEFLLSCQEARAPPHGTWMWKRPAIELSLQIDLADCEKVALLESTLHMPRQVRPPKQSLCSLRPHTRRQTMASQHMRAVPSHLASLPMDRLVQCRPVFADEKQGLSDQRLSGQLEDPQCRLYACHKAVLLHKYGSNAMSCLTLSMFPITFLPIMCAIVCIHIGRRKGGLSTNSAPRRSVHERDGSHNFPFPNVEGSGTSAAEARSRLVASLAKPCAT